MSKKRPLVVIDDDEDYNFKVLLPNSTSVTLTLTKPEREMSMEDFVHLVKQEYDKTRNNFELSDKKRKMVDWNRASKSYLECNGEKIQRTVRFEKFQPNLCNIIRLDDGSGETSIMYENMWDLTPDTDLLKEIPQTYSFETALADLIDNSLQAVWSSSLGDRKLIRVDVSNDRITVFDSGPGMDSSSIDKWGKIGASLHRSETKAIGGKPPYLMPLFGMYGFGGPYASMNLGRRTLLSSKTKLSNKVFSLQLIQDALIDNHSVSGKSWKVAGGMRDPLEEELTLSPHRSFTKVEIFDMKCKIPTIKQLQCILKDIYFPYIQCDEISKTRKTERPVEFQVNEADLIEINGGKVATTNLHSKGHEFWFQLRFTIGEKYKGTYEEANARLKFLYLPIVQGEESINTVLNILKEEGYNVSESFQTFSRVSVRRLGRLLPDVPWVSIPFLQKGTIASILQKCCQRVICFIDLDAGFYPNSSKTDLASPNVFTMALKFFGSRSKEKDNDVNIKIRRDETHMSYEQVEQGYKEWVLEMHKNYDTEEVSGEDDAVYIFEPLDKALCIPPDCSAVRVNEEMTRKGKLWKRGQNIRIMKGACAGAHKTDVYATIDYFIRERFENEAKGDARIICRQINYSEEEGCMLLTNEGSSHLEIRRSSSYPISIIDSGKCLPLDKNAWNKKLKKQREKDPSKIDLLNEMDCISLNLNEESTLSESMVAGETPPRQLVAVVRNGSFASSSKVSKKLDQRNIVKMNKDMLMEVKLVDTNMKSRDKNAKPVYSRPSFPTSRGGFHGLYIFPLESEFLFKKAGTYNFCFSVGNSITCNRTVVVGPSSTVGSWKVAYNLDSIDVQVGSIFPPCSIACFDEYENQIPFTSVPSLEVKLNCSTGFLANIDNDKIEASLIDGILKVENIFIETDKLDQMRPNYKAALEIRSKDEPFSVSVDCRVIPGPPKRVVEKNSPQALENLFPDSTVENLVLEMFDGYNNHVPEGADVQIRMDGFCIQDSMALNRKADSRGCVDLSGILKVTVGYGKSVSLSVLSGVDEIFKKVSLIEERELSLLTKLPETFAAGSNLPNLVFKVTEPDGTIDTRIHHDVKSGCHHTMTIESDSSTDNSGRLYAFMYGTCKVPSLSLPENEGVVSFRAYHSQYHELQMSFKIQLTQTFGREEVQFSTPFEREEIGCSTTFEREEVPCSLPLERDEIVFSTSTERMIRTPQSKVASNTKQPLAPTPETPCSQFGVLPMRNLLSSLGSHTGVMNMADFTECLKERLDAYNKQRMEVDKCLNFLEAEKAQAEQVLSTLQASLEPLGAVYPELLSTKEAVMKEIEEKHFDTPASVFCCLYKKAPPPQSCFLAKKGVFGIVALLGSVASTSLSRVLSEYLGEDTMLALVCKSSQFGPNSNEYRRLQSEAAKLGRSITTRLHVLCLESLDGTGPWMNGVLENDPQRRLAIDDPRLPNGDLIPGFKGYAVNKINLASGELTIRTNSGHGLRETLFYGLFKNLQVYETQKNVEAALPYIHGCGAVSLDGFIVKKHRFIYSGSSKPDIYFPITVNENEEEKLRKLKIARDRVRGLAKKIVEEKRLLVKIEKKLKKAKERYEDATTNFL